jgi:hypothetical protein
LSPQGFDGRIHALPARHIQNGFDRILSLEVDHDIGPELFRQFLPLRDCFPCDDQASP